MCCRRRHPICIGKILQLQRYYCTMLFSCHCLISAINYIKSGLLVISAVLETESLTPRQTWTITSCRGSLFPCQPALGLLAKAFLLGLLLRVSYRKRWAWSKHQGAWQRGRCSPRETGKKGLFRDGPSRSTDQSPPLVSAAWVSSSTRCSERCRITLAGDAGAF